MFAKNKRRESGQLQLRLRSTATIRSVRSVSAELVALTPWENMARPLPPSAWTTLQPRAHRWLAPRRPRSARASRSRILHASPAARRWHSCCSLARRRGE
jgi:hypothetical protein